MPFTPEQQASDETTPIAQLRELAGQSTALARLVAGNFSADSELLRTLAAHDDCVVRQLVTANPNVPLDLLERLVKQHPIQVLNNPAIDLFLLEKPDLLVGLSLKDVTIRALIKRSLASPKFLDYAANLPNEKVQMAIAMNPHTPRDILERLMESRKVDIIEAAQMHINWSERDGEDWRSLFQKMIESVKENDRQTKDESNHWLVRLWKKARKILFGETYTFKRLMSQCITPKLQATQGVPKPITNLEKIKKLRSKTEEVKSAIVSVILIVFISPFLLVIILTIWSERLLKRNHTAQHPYKSPKISLRLSAKQLEVLTQQAEKDLETVSELDQYRCLRHLEKIARHPNIAPATLQQLLLHKHDRVRCAAFENSKTIQLIEEHWGCEVLHKIDSKHLYGLALEPTTSEGILAMLVQHHKESVCLATALNPCAGNYVLEQCQKSIFYSGNLEYRLKTLQAEFEEWFEEWIALSVDSRLAILTHPKVPIGILAKAFRSDWWLERCAIAQNPSTPRSIRQRLAEDGNWVVRAAARETL